MLSSRMSSQHASANFAAYNKSKGICFDKRFLERPFSMNQLKVNQIRDVGIFGELEGVSDIASDCILMYAMLGCASLTIHDSVQAWKEKQFVIIPSNQAWRVTQIEQQREPFRFVLFDLKYKPGSTIWLDPQHAGANTITDDQLGLDDVVIRLLAEISHPGEHAATLIGSYIEQLCIQTARQLTIEPLGEAYPMRPDKKELAYLAMQYIDLSLHRIEELSDVATALGYSYSHLSHVFSSEMGMPLQSYWTRKRIMKAMSQLQTGHASITQIAEGLHYQSIHSFSKAFKKVAGMTPSEYQTLYGSSSG